MEENRTENFDFNLYSEKITAWRRVRGTINQANCLLSRLRGISAEKIREAPCPRYQHLTP